MKNKTSRSSRRIYLLQYLDAQSNEKFTLGCYSTASNYHSTYLSIKTFTRGKDLPMSSVTKEWVNAYASFLHARGLVRNTVSFYMRIIRAVYNRALLERPFRTFGNPFREVYTGVDKTVKRSLRLNDIAKIAAMHSNSTRTRAFALTQDLFMFSFFSRGMCFVDMAALKWSNVHDGRIAYVRKKTGQKMDVKIEPCMRALMEKYRSSSEYIFPILRSDDPVVRYRQYRNQLCRYNARLKMIGKDIGLSAPLTSYCSRHSWASACHDAGVSVSAISSALGHTNETTTQIYLSSMNGDVLDRANSRLLSRLSKIPSMKNNSKYSTKFLVY